MERTIEIIKNNVFYILFGFGAIGHLLPWSFDFMLLFTPYFLFGVSIFILISLFIDGGLRNLLLAILVTILAYLIEVIGVNTGIIFGEYTYSNLLGPKVFDTVLLIGPLWLILLVGAHAVVKEAVIRQQVGISLWTEMLAISFMLVLVDLFLEVMAVGLGYWSWGGPVPLQNYVAWFLIALALSPFILRLKIDSDSIVHFRKVFISLTLFIIILALSFLT